MSNLHFRSTPGIGDDDRQLVIRPAGRDTISVKIGNQLAIVVDADELQRLVESAAEDCAAHVNETSTGGYLPHSPLPDESRKGDTAGRVWRCDNGNLYRWGDTGVWEALPLDGVKWWLPSTYDGPDEMTRTGLTLTEVPPAQSGEATA